MEVVFMLPTTHTYSSFAAKDIAAEKQFYSKTLGIDVGELYDGGLLELRLGGDKRVLIYSKDDFTPATYTVLNFPVPDVDAAVDELVRSGVEMARFDGFDQDEKGIARGDEGPTIAWFRDPAGNILAVHSDEEPPA
jgi:predicted enzyme related to lactoylglutathione lyase